MPSTRKSRPPLADALREALTQTGVSQTELARRLGMRMSTIGTYCNDREPSHRAVQEMERALGLPSGWLLAKAGYLRPPRSFEQWVAIDQRFTEDGKRMLLTLATSLAGDKVTSAPGRVVNHGS